MSAARAPAVRGPLARAFAASSASTVPPEGVAEAVLHANGMGQINLNRPHALNALSLPMVEQIVAHLLSWAGNPAVKAVLFTGAGPKAFWYHM